MKLKKPQVILTDIEGTTTAITFVADELFPYFRANINDLLDLKSNPIVKEAFESTVELALSEDNQTIQSDEEICATLHRWSVEDRKITPLKTVQGVLWEKGYKDGVLKGHVYQDVAPTLTDWKNSGITLGVFSSGSIAAQKLLFGYSTEGDLTPLFSAYFDTTTGGKKETSTYGIIAQQLATEPQDILFLSDIPAELIAAKDAGFQTIQLVRPGTTQAWGNTVATLDQIHFI